ncbi:MAG: HD domain-containing protein [Heliobacteriaceae bacterium]|nr:HD domain-containing protein [Heliobacteriaceae bacterium]
MSVNQLKIGDMLARDLFAASGRVLLGKGIALTAGYISKLDQLGVSMVYIEDPRFDDIVVEDPISGNTRLAAMTMVAEIADALQLPRKEPMEWDAGDTQKFLRKVDTRRLQVAVRDIVEDVLENRDVVIHLADMRAKEDRLLGHAVMTTVLATLCGAQLQLTRNQLHELAMGCLLHDIGMVYIDQAIITKPVPLMRPDEAAMYRKHPQLGFEVLRKVRELSIISAHVAFQHHETLDGQGFPRRLNGDKIHVFAKIVAVADFFDLLVHGGVGRKVLPHLACEAVMSLVGSKFEHAVVDAFVRHIAMYPNGFSVRLSTNEIGVVVKQNEATARPVVRVLFDDADGRVKTREYDLTRHLTVFITEVLI